jgi:hypothetical protein
MSSDLSHTDSVRLLSVQASWRRGEHLGYLV